MPGDLVKNFPYRIKPSGLTTIANGDYVLYKGLDCVQKRGQFIISNLDAAAKLYLSLDKAESRIFSPVWISSTLAYNIGEDIYVYNNSGGTVSYIVCELFFDEGVQLPPAGFAGGGLTPAQLNALANNLPTGTPLARPAGRTLGPSSGSSSGPWRSNSGSTKP